MGRLLLSIDSNLDDVCLATLAINRICRHLGLDEAGAGMMELCAAEAITNSIKHAYGGAGGRQVTVCVMTAQDTIELDVIDHGLSMPEEQIGRLVNGSPFSFEDVEDLSVLEEHGRGLQIIHDVMDVVRYDREEGSNHLRMTKILA